MSLILPEREVIEAQLTIFNEELVTIGQEAKAQGLTPLSPEDLQYEEDQYTVLSPTTTPSAFWNHHIGGVLAGVMAQLEILEYTGKYDEEIIKTVQGRVYRLTTKWMRDSLRRNDSLNVDTTKAFLGSGFSFDWRRNPFLTKKMQSSIHDIADLYTMREGHQPISFHGILRGVSAPSKAYLMCVQL